jgi:hypothetical protein
MRIKVIAIEGLPAILSQARKSLKREKANRRRGFRLGSELIIPAMGVGGFFPATRAFASAR